MKVLRDREMTLWLLLLLAVVLLLIYRIGFHIPVPGFDEEAVRNLLAK
jgi:preprotein translocase subunit SecY